MKIARRRPDTLPAIAASLSAALDLAISRVDVPGIEVMLLAAETGLTADDASYVWLARASGVELLTLDAGLVRVATDGSAV